MVKIAVCDDDASAREELRRKLSAFFHERGGDAASVHTFSQASELTEAPDHQRFDIYFLDVLMPGMDGIELGRRLRAGGADGVIIYLTSSAEYAISSFDVGAFHYLIKPLDQEKLTEVLSRACEVLETRRRQGTVVRTRDGEIFIPYMKLLYADLHTRAVQYHLTDGQTIQGVTMRVSFPVAVAPLLEDSRFTLCGASWCINLSFVSAMERKSITFSNGDILFMPSRAIDPLRSKWLDYWLE